MGCSGEEQQQIVYNIELPEAHQRRCVGSTGNWLITTDLCKRIHLLNPFTRAQFDLPPQTKFKFRIGPYEGATPEQHRDTFLRKLVVSSTASLSKSNSGSGTSNDCIVMAIHHYWKKLAIARPGDRYWASVYTPKNYFEDIIFYKEQFYAVNHRGIVMVCNIGDGQHSPAASKVTRRLPESMLSHYQVKYLVEWCGELLMVIKNVLNLDNYDKKKRRKEIPLYKTGTFHVYKLDFRNREWEELYSLGEYCLFLGSNTSVSVLPGHYSGGLQKNCIYFTDDFTFGYRGTGIPGGRDMGVFDLGDKTIRPHYRGVSTCYYSPPLWLIPTLPAK
ncbi:Ubiquitin-protein ligase protein [Thalictrum thalictroides]|uniref:Ubiquitin-protein ligase protein n=1 Tax=Thalictrum thalictroides TaxID=46969 RepID=A0A7J6W9V7_THATH|nr:Ubiquitin-protein ligase protein [Thalictrum thalictroides]